MMADLNALAGLGTTAVYVGELIKWVVQLFVVFGGLLPYLPQYWTIRKTKDAEGFSTFVCFVLIVANVLRILFW